MIDFSKSGSYFNSPPSPRRLRLYQMESEGRQTPNFDPKASMDDARHADTVILTCFTFGARCQMGIEPQIDDRAATQAQGNVELGCSLVLTALYWPFMSSAMVTFHVLLGVPKEPFELDLAFPPIMLVALSACQLAMQILPSEQKTDFLAVFRQGIKIVPYFLVIMIIHFASHFVLKFGWTTANRYAFILFGSFAAGAVCTACTYVFWRLLVHPILNPKNPSSTK
jgi:hypothetical protein